VALSYRLHRDEDLEELQNLWEENTDWGSLTPDLWRKHIVEAPLGGASILLAIDDQSGRIVGEFAFMPSRVRVNGREISAFRPAAPIVAKGYRFFSANPLAHPALVMYRQAVEALRDRGEGLIYMVPDPRWVRLLKMFPGLQVGTFPLYSLPLPLSAGPLPIGEGYKIGPVDLRESRVDRLWEHSAKLHSCSIVRDSRSLPWKIGKGDDEYFGVERDGELVAIVATRAKGDRQWLVTDLLFEDANGSLRAALAAAANLGHERATAAGPPLKKVGVLATAPMEAAVRSLGFSRDRYDFPLVVQCLDPAIEAAEIATPNWFVSAND
jgi:hypothetical protein